MERTTGTVMMDLLKMWSPIFSTSDDVSSGSGFEAAPSVRRRNARIRADSL